MRVLQINKFHYVKGGAERYYLDISEALRHRGHQVNHLAMAHPSNLPATPGDRFVEEVDYRGGLGPVAKVRHGLRAIWNREAERAVLDLARAKKPTVAHLHNIYHQLSPSVIAALRTAGVPVVQTLHDYKLVCPAYLLMTEGRICERCKGGRYLEAVRHRCLLDSTGASLIGAAEAFLHEGLGTYRKVDRFLCPSRFMLEKVAEFGVARESLVHLPYFVAIERYRPALDPASEPLRCVYVGRLSREKGIATLIEAMGRLPQGRLKLRVLGEGPLRGELEARAETAAPGRVEFLGYRSGDALHQAIRDAAFAVVPSEWYENLPYAILEPFALGRPVVGAKIGGIPELVIDGETGRLHRSGDAASLADALLWMTGPEADLPRMGRTARTKIEREHGIEAHLDRLLAIYEEVSSGKTSGGEARV